MIRLICQNKVIKEEKLLNREYLSNLVHMLSFKLGRFNILTTFVARSEIEILNVFLYRTLKVMQHARGNFGKIIWTNPWVRTSVSTGSWKGELTSFASVPFHVHF